MIYAVASKALLDLEHESIVLTGALIMTARGDQVNSLVTPTAAEINHGGGSFSSTSLILAQNCVYFFYLVTTPTNICIRTNPGT